MPLVIITVSIALMFIHPALCVVPFLAIWVVCLFS